jgi:hypothetical protein
VSGALQMKKKEKAKVSIQASKAFGSKGNPEKGVPPDTDVEYEVRWSTAENGIDVQEEGAQDSVGEYRVGASFCIRLEFGLVWDKLLPLRSKLEKASFRRSSLGESGFFHFQGKGS